MYSNHNVQRLADQLAPSRTIRPPRYYMLDTEKPKYQKYTPLNQFSQLSQFNEFNQLNQDIQDNRLSQDIQDNNEGSQHVDQLSELTNAIRQLERRLAARLDSVEASILYNKIPSHEPTENEPRASPCQCTCAHKNPTTSSNSHSSPSFTPETDVRLPTTEPEVPENFMSRSSSPVPIIRGNHKRKQVNPCLTTRFVSPERTVYAQVARRSCQWKNCEKTGLTLVELKNHIVYDHIEPKGMAYTHCFWKECNSYGKNFSRLCGILSHIRYHTGDIPYKCHILNCRKGFYRRFHLEKHLPMHTKQSKSIICPHRKCGIIFKLPSDFVSHIEKEHEDNWDDLPVRKSIYPNKSEKENDSRRRR
ncbi:C2H2-type zinc finger transcription factor [Phycomyces blakesleeanus]|uniref:C2H2-type zinc finger transcription factor n=1 Tax=Phycomyces blakesleeanus TaxID=4837 RepID=A0ABR3BF73_PHYBL